jgi:hypothetical protein
VILSPDSNEINRSFVCKAKERRHIRIHIQLMTLDEVNTTIYQPQRSDYHQDHRTMGELKIFNTSHFVTYLVSCNYTILSLQTQSNFDRH